ncbi:MAG: hypothetical protein FWC33_02315 [Candidatus Bathyarchaeota archaeon]|nr:hypothetical protein [Candidatus Termiticorpusculum sp.]
MMYDTKMDVWSERRTAPTLIDDGIKAGVTTGIYAPQKVYVLFGTLDTLVYDFANDSWSSGQVMSTDRRKFGVAVVDDILYIIGGFIYGSTTPACATNEQYIPIGYHSISIPEPSVPPGPSVTPEFTLIYLIVITLVIGTAVIGLFFFLKKRQRGCTGDITLFNVVSVYNNDDGEMV